jgi:hypothetical protein
VNDYGREIIGKGVTVTHHRATVAEVQPLTHVNRAYHVVFKITSGEMAGHVVSFRIYRMAMRYKQGDEVLISLEFRSGQHNGITHYALRGNIVENVNEC